MHEFDLLAFALALFVFGLLGVRLFAGALQYHCFEIDTGIIRFGSSPSSPPP